MSIDPFCLCEEMHRGAATKVLLKKENQQPNIVFVRCRCFACIVHCITIHCLDVVTIQCDPCVMSFTVLHLILFNGWILWYKNFTMFSGLAA